MAIVELERWKRAKWHLSENFGNRAVMGIVSQNVTVEREKLKKSKSCMKQIIRG